VIDRVVPGGDGMARLADGRVGFATGALPGDTIRPLAIEAKKGHVRATRFEILTPSTERVKPPCPVAEACGGCDFMALAPTAQLSRKEELLREALTRIGGFTSLPEGLSVVRVGPELRYRSRVRFHVDAAGKIGFYARGSHAIVEVPACLVCRPEIDELLAALRGVPKDSLAALSEIDVRVADEGVKASVRLVARFPGGAGPALKVVVAKLPRDVVVTIDDGDGRASAGEQRFALPGGTYLLAEPGVFTQVNWPVNVALVEAVVRGARARGVTRFLDAYAGAGNFSIPMLHAGLRGVSVERDARAVECARRAAAAQGLPEDGFVADDAEKHLEGLARKKAPFDLVLLDPPRSGARAVLPSVERLAPRVVAFCSCDPVTLSRDLATLSRAGYHLDEVRGFDMFPSTHHLETMAWMSRAT
jgi:23S rRNA (uracil1939-C5)-methyltransferase